MDTKKVLLYGGGILAIGVVLIWLHKKSQANAQAATDQANNDAALASELAAMGPYSTGVDTSGTSTTTPTVDTGNTSLQTLINSILNPQPIAVATPVPVPTTTVGTSTSSSNPTNPTTGSAPISVQPVGPEPVQVGVYSPSGVQTVATAPIMLRMPLATTVIQ